MAREYPVICFLASTADMFKESLSESTAMGIQPALRIAMGMETHVNAGTRISEFFFSSRERNSETVPVLEYPKETKCLDK